MELEKNYCNSKESTEWEMGIDEAGRGPVFGSMVYGACIWPIQLKEELKNIGFADSKKLTAAQRESLFEKIKQLNNIKMHYKLENLTPIFLSNQQLAPYETNLNQISHNSAFNLINAAIKDGYNIKIVYLDTVGPKDSYRTWLEGKFKSIKADIIFEVSEKADSKFPVVSAASICAKVTRDELLNQWQFREAKQFSREFGSGYPSDPKTVKWLETNFENIFGFPQLIRFSWKTTETAMEKKGLTFKYKHEDKPDTQKQLKQKIILKKKFSKVKYSNLEF